MLTRVIGTRSPRPFVPVLLFLFDEPAPTEIYTLSLHDALPIFELGRARPQRGEERQLAAARGADDADLLRIDAERSEEHTSELQSHSDLVCRLLLEKKNSQEYSTAHRYTSTCRVCDYYGPGRPF